jgi:hypothetical protein
VIFIERAHKEIYRKIKTCKTIKIILLLTIVQNVQVKTNTWPWSCIWRMDRCMDG